MEEQKSYIGISPDLISDTSLQPKLDLMDHIRPSLIDQLDYAFPEFEAHFPDHLDAFSIFPTIPATPQPGSKDWIDIQMNSFDLLYPERQIARPSLLKELKDAYIAELKTEGIDLTKPTDAQDLELYKQCAACVVVSLESAVGTAAGDPDYQFRFQDQYDFYTRFLDELTSVIRNNGHNAEDLKQAIMNLWKQGLSADFSSLGALIENLIKVKTPLGIELTNWSYVLTELNPDQIKERLHEGVKVLVNVFLTLGNHMAHVELDDEGNLISKSDGEIPIKDILEKPHRCLILTKKEK